MANFNKTREHLTRLQKAQESRQFIESYLNQRQEWKRLEQQRMEEENEKIELYAKMQREREADLAAKKKANEDQRGAIYEKVRSTLLLPILYSTVANNWLILLYWSRL